jgi:hypothetical protein
LCPDGWRLFRSEGRSIVLKSSAAADVAIAKELKKGVISVRELVAIMTEKMTLL